MNRKDLERTLEIMRQAWGRSNSGYAFLPWIDREEQIRTGQRRAGFNEGPAFKWPADKEKMLKHLSNHEQHDMYWCPVLFEEPVRQEEMAGPEYCLWADLDEVDPNLIEDYPPTVAWETSPDRFQALWILNSGGRRAMSAPGKENQRLTYLLDADKSGWDTTQLLRVPGWTNHKPEYLKKYGKAPVGKLLWRNGRRWQLDEFDDLPEIEVASADVSDALEFDIEHVDRHKVIARIKLKLNKRARELLSARMTSGDVSAQLWYLMRCLADVGCSLAEIVAIARETVWNKFSGRNDEMKRLIAEAGKAIAQRSEEKTEAIEEELEEERPEPQLLGTLLKNIKPPKFLVDRLLTVGACGFIAGEPKSYKSWLGLDLALSVATGRDFLNHFEVVEPGPVFYIQEEDPPPLLKERTGKIWANKTGVQFDYELDEHGHIIPESLYWGLTNGDEEFNPNITAYIQNGVVISDPAWQLWLDEQIEKGLDEEPYKLVVIDTLMMVAGEVEENKSQEMTTKVYKPLKTLSRKHNVAVVVVHHMGKSKEAKRSGQRLLGGVANHAWSEDSMYLMHAGMSDLKLELESKHIPGNAWRLTNINNRDWDPIVSPWRPEEDEAPNQNRNGSDQKSSPRHWPRPNLDIKKALEQSDHPVTAYDLAKVLKKRTRRSIQRQLVFLEGRGLIIQSTEGKWSLP